MKLQLLTAALAGIAFHSSASASDATIGLADGVSYQIVDSSDVSLPAVQCGFSDAGLPIPGTYSRESRHYIRYSKGVRLEEWDETVDVFKECASP